MQDGKSGCRSLCQGQYTDSVIGSKNILPLLNSSLPLVSGGQTPDCQIGKASLPVYGYQANPLLALFLTANKKHRFVKADAFQERIMSPVFMVRYVPVYPILIVAANHFLIVNAPSETSKTIYKNVLGKTQAEVKWYALVFPVGLRQTFHQK